MNYKRVLLLVLAMCVLFTFSANAVDAVDSSTPKIYVGSVSFAQVDSEGAARNSNNGEVETELCIPAIITETQNADGTITSESTCWVDENQSGMLVSAYTEDELIELMASDSHVGGIYGSSAYTITMSATWSEVNMYEITSGATSGYCYAPVSAKFKFTKNSGTTSITNASMMTGLYGINVRYVSDPTSVDDNLYADFTRTYTSSAPISGYQYSFDDYTYYVNEGFSGRYIYMNSGYGGYFLKTDFTYGSHDYASQWGISSNIDDNDYVIS